MGFSHYDSVFDAQHRCHEIQMKRIYISGPMTSCPSLNFPAFNAAANRLRNLGYEVVNPAEIDQGLSPTWGSCMRRDIAELMTCDTIALLNGWELSKGAHLEVHIAHRVGIRIVNLKDITA